MDTDPLRIHNIDKTDYIDDVMNIDHLVQKIAHYCKAPIQPLGMVVCVQCGYVRLHAVGSATPQTHTPRPRGSTKLTRASLR